MVLQTGDFSKGSVPLNMKHHQLRLNSFLYDNTWVYFKIEGIRIVLMKLFSSDFYHTCIDKAQK